MKTYIVIFPMLITAMLQAQDIKKESKQEFDIGLGIGIDYGGIGIRGTIKPIHRLGLFAAAGYNLNSVGFNAGGQWHFPKNRHSFYLTGMYGYNAVISVSGFINDKGTYYGFSAGAGYQLISKRHSNFWNFELLVPFRNSNYKNDLDAIKELGASTTTEPIPVAISIGYHFRIL